MESYMALLPMQLQTKEEKSSVHHLQLALVVLEHNKSVSGDWLLQISSIKLFTLLLEFRLAFVVKNFILCKGSSALYNVSLRVSVKRRRN